MMTYTIAPPVWDENDTTVTLFGKIRVQPTECEDWDALPVGSPGPAPMFTVWEAVWAETNELLDKDVLVDTKEEAKAAVGAWNEKKMLAGLVPAYDIVPASSVDLRDEMTKEIARELQAEENAEIVRELQYEEVIRELQAEEHAEIVEALVLHGMVCPMCNYESDKEPSLDHVFEASECPNCHNVVEWQWPCCRCNAVGDSFCESCQEWADRQ